MSRPRSAPSLPVNIHAGGRQVEPDDFGGVKLKAERAARMAVANVVAVLHPFAGGSGGRQICYTDLAVAVSIQRERKMMNL